MYVNWDCPDVREPQAKERLLVVASVAVAIVGPIATVLAAMTFESERIALTTVLVGCVASLAVALGFVPVVDKHYRERCRIINESLTARQNELLSALGVQTRQNLTHLIRMDPPASPVFVDFIGSHNDVEALFKAARDFDQFRVFDQNAREIHPADTSVAV